MAAISFFISYSLLILFGRHFQTWFRVFLVVDEITSPRLFGLPKRTRGRPLPAIGFEMPSGDCLLRSVVSTWLDVNVDSPGDLAEKTIRSLVMASLLSAISSLNFPAKNCESFSPGV
jgi:hypothetical protein